MLKHLHIENYALISHLDIDFSAGFSVLTGETGAGKTIVLGALALVLGARADNKVITDGETKCIIEAEFDEYIIRRELYSNGKSRSFIDDSIVTLGELKALSTQLIDIHSQHANLLIENSDFQLSIVDAIANNDGLYADYVQAYEVYTQALQHLNDLNQLVRKSQQDADYIQFKFNQLDEAQLRSDELEELEAEHYQLSHAEELRSSLFAACEILNGEQGSIVDMLRACRIENASASLQERIDSARIELQDIAEEAERYIDRIEMNPERLEWVEERLSFLNDLLRKYDARTIDELIAERDRLDELIGKMDSYDFEMELAQKQLDAAREQLQLCSENLTLSRTKVIPQICDQLIAGAHRLGITHAKIEIPITPTEDFTPTGSDSVQFMFAANLNQSLRPINEVASGGEVSRIMLCIKSLIASTKGLPTIIFDEIDTGVSGDIATQMATIMRDMASTRQIIAITHLPQIAAIGQTHYKVYKSDTTTRTETHILQLNQDERITEIASMLSGKNPSQEAIANAKQLLCNH